MTKTVEPKRKSDIDPNFQRQVNARKNGAKDEHEHGTSGGQVQVMMPDLNGWDGNLFAEKFEDLSKPFERTKANEQFIEAVKDAENPGVSGDLVATTTQIDYLATMERAFRARHTSRFPRMVAHSLGRKLGHGHTNGVFAQLALEYVRGVLKQAGG